MADKAKEPACILAVDDDVRMLDSLRVILPDPYKVLTAASGEEALGILSKRNVDLMFLDIHMPGGMSGLEVLKRVKDSGENIPIVMLTATNTAKTAVEAMKSG